MKSIKHLLVLLVCIGSTLNTFSQQELSSIQWQEDLRFLQETVHKKYSFLFKKISQKKWDKEVEKFYAEIPTMEQHQIKVGMTRMVSLFEYGHTQIPFGTLANDAVLPINLYHFKDGIYIEGVQKGNEKALGAKVLKIGAMPIDEALTAIRPVVPAENDSYFKGYGLRFLTVPAVLHAQGVIPELSNDIAITLEKDGASFEVSFTAIPLAEMSRNYGFTLPTDKWLSARDHSKTPLYLKHLSDKLYYFEYLPETQVLYVRQSSVFSDEKEPLADFYKRLFAFIDANEISKLVYDVRLNGGGNNSNNKPLIKGIMARPKINQRGKFFYIVGRNTFSAAQNLTNEIENYTEAILVGEPTAENKNFYGDARKVTLPHSSINAYLSFAWWQDKAPWDRADATLPHIAQELSFKDYVTNSDIVLESAVNYTDTGFILDPMEHLTQLFIAGNYEKVKEDGLKIAADPAYKYYDFEKEFSAAGNRVLDMGNHEGGIFILNLVAEYFPESEGALYNLATSQEKIKLFDQAKETYKKHVTKWPNSLLGKAAKKKLEALQKH